MARTASLTPVIGGYSGAQYRGIDYSMLSCNNEHSAVGALSMGTFVSDDISQYSREASVSLHVQ